MFLIEDEVRKQRNTDQQKRCERKGQDNGELSARKGENTDT